MTCPASTRFAHVGRLFRVFRILRGTVVPVLTPGLAERLGGQFPVPLAECMPPFGPELAGAFAPRVGGGRASRVTSPAAAAGPRPPRRPRAPRAGGGPPRRLAAPESRTGGGVVSRHTPVPGSPIAAPDRRAPARGRGWPAITPC